MTSTERGMDNGGPAFPRVVKDTGEPTEIHFGMSLRDYFAAAAMQGISGNTDYDFSVDNMAVFAYEQADAMLRSAKMTPKQDTTEEETKDLHIERRDIAAMAMQSLIITCRNKVQMAEGNIAHWAVRHADALLEELKK